MKKDEAAPPLSSYTAPCTNPSLYFSPSARVLCRRCSARSTLTADPRGNIVDDMTTSIQNMTNLTKQQIPSEPVDDGDSMDCSKLAMTLCSRIDEQIVTMVDSFSCMIASARIDPKSRMLRDRMSSQVYGEKIICAGQNLYRTIEEMKWSIVLNDIRSVNRQVRKRRDICRSYCSSVNYCLTNLQHDIKVSLAQLQALERDLHRIPWGDINVEKESTRL